MELAPSAVACGTLLGSGIGLGGVFYFILFSFIFFTLFILFYFIIFFNIFILFYFILFIYYVLFLLAACFADHTRSSTASPARGCAALPKPSPCGWTPSPACCPSPRRPCRSSPRGSCSPTATSSTAPPGTPGRPPTPSGGANGLNAQM